MAKFRLKPLEFEGERTQTGFLLTATDRPATLCEFVDWMAEFRSIGAMVPTHLKQLRECFDPLDDEARKMLEGEDGVG